MISAVVLTHNSEKTLATTLESLQFSDEIIVVDDNSSDRTLEIAHMYKARVFKRSLQDNFAAQRNYGLERAKGPASPERKRGEGWVLFIDSDEVVPVDLGREIETVTLASNSTIVGYFISRQDFFGGRGLRYGETSRVSLLRLAKKNSGVWIEPVHEIWHVSGKTETLVNPIHHLPHSDVAQFLGKINWYSSIRARYLYSVGKRSSLLQILLYPKAKFIINYVWKLGFLDGMEGMIMAMMMSFHSFLVRAKLWTLERRIQE